MRIMRIIMRIKYANGDLEHDVDNDGDGDDAALYNSCVAPR